MAKIIWSKLALADIVHIHDFIAKDAPVYAEKTIHDFFTHIEILNNFPEAGREVPKYSRKDIRELIIGNYRIFYRIRKSHISVIRVHHSAKQIPRKRKN